MSGGSIVNQWGASRGLNAELPEPGVLPLAVELNSGSSTGGGSGEPTAGNWLFGVAAWRQDAGSVPTIIYPSTVNIRDDVHNFWTPVQVVAPETGIVRTSVWMAPAARAPEFVFASPTAYQSALAVSVMEVTADVPWYSVAVTATNYTNQGTAVTLSQDPASGLFSVGVIAYDLNSLTVTFTDSGWTEEAQVTASNAVDHTADLTLTPFTATTTGSSMTLAASGTGGNADWAEVLVTVHGVTDAIAFPYTLELENWPALVTEMATGEILNQNWAFNSGISPWTAQNSATVAASSVFTFGNSAGSLLVTPDGSHANSGAISEKAPAAPFATYTATAWVMIPAGWSGGVTLGIAWLNSGGSSISNSTQNFTITGSQQELTFNAVSPAATAFAQLFVQLAGVSDPPSTATVYIGFASFALAGAFGAIPDDQLNWTDFSGRTITQAAARISRGIQYEQQSLEAGTLEIPLANNDGALTAGNQQSPYYPYAGQTDVPIRVRAIWPDSLTPYSVLYSGYTDDVKVQWSEETQYGYVVVTAADCWSRLTAQMLTAAQQEILQDIPAGSSGALWTCNDQAGAVTAANTAPTTIPSLAVQISKFGNAGTSGGFGDTSIALIGDPSGTGWRLSGLTGTTGVNVGTSLIVFPPDPAVLPPPSGGVTVEFWVDIEAEVSSVNWNGVLAACIGANGPVWQLEIDAPTGADNGEISFIVFDKITHAATITLVNVGLNWNTTVLFAVTFTQTTWAVYQDGALLDNGSCNFANAYNGYTFNGQCVPYQGLSGYCVNAVYHNIALYPGVLPQSRLISHYNVAFSAEQDEIDTSRVARVTGYGGFTPPLAMLGLFNEWPDAGVDPVTQITDTIGQVVSSYITNIASSTLAALFVDGPGALVYRRRNEWYDRAQGQWTLGEKASLPLNVNPYFGTSVTSWAATNAALAWAAGQGQFGGSGAAQLTASGGGQVILNPETQPASPGQQYSCVIAVMCPAGYAAGGLAQLVWINASNTVISRTSGNTVPLVAGAWTWLIVTGQAPAATAKLRGNFDSSGTPSNGTVFYVSSVLTTVYPGEVPYLRDVRLSDDRAQLFNTAILTQSGTNEQTTFSGTSLNFTPTSGIIVTAQNSASVAVRGGVPYTATVYLQNTAQTTPLVAFFTNNPGFTPTAFVPAEGCIEDLAQWIINTLGNPVLRGEQAVITPFATSGATRQAMTLALQAEVGDTITLNRRPVGAPAVSLVMYLSNIQHDIDIRTGWTTTYQLSPAPVASILFTDDPSNGVLDGTSLLGW